MFIPMKNKKALKAISATLGLLSLASQPALATTVVRATVTRQIPGRAVGQRGRVVVVTPASRPVPQPARPPVSVVPVNVHVNNRYGRDGSLVIRPPGRDRVDQSVAKVFIMHSEGRSCQQLGELLRELSNDILHAIDLPEHQTEEERNGPIVDRERWLKVQRARELKGSLSAANFRQTVLSRLSEMYRSCNVQCFDDGVSIGVISGTGYCNAAVQLGGLPDAGFAEQGRLPLCQTENFMGCQQGFIQAVNSVQGCLTYASGSFEALYDHQVSQDCHIDQ